MSLTPWLPNVRKIKDGEAVDQATVNVPIDQLTQREQHLYEKFEELSGKSVLISFGQAIHPAETLPVDELSVVYYKSDAAGVGLAKSVTGFSTNSSSSAFQPKDSNYVFGLLKKIYPTTKTADLYTEGLCELPVNIDDLNLGLIQRQTDGTVEPFAVGPYFLSAKSPGKITRDPSGIPVYVGFAISKRRFLLHTSVDEFSQFFINFRYHILDRVAGKPQLSGSVWTITEPSLAYLGWVPASFADVPYPTGATFFYNIPTSSVLSADTGLDSYIADTGLPSEHTVYYERDEALELNKQLPPVPANFIQLYVNGTLARYKDSFDTSGVYSVNEYGIWWHSNLDGQQPWAANYPSNVSPANWTSSIKATISATRKRMFTSFSKFNPALRTQLVSSIAPFNTNSNKATNFLKFYSADNLNETGRTGDILVDVSAPVYYKGFSDNSTFTYPATVDPNYTAGRAVASFVYDKALGGFKAATTPVVAKLVGIGNVKTTDQGAGIWKVEYTAGGATGQVDSIEPINARLEFRGLTSYIKLPVPSTTPYGLIGKIILPKGYSNSSKLNLVFHLFGDVVVSSGSANKTIAFQLEYSAVSAANGASPSSYTTITTNTFTPDVNPVEFSLTSEASYTAYTAVKISDIALSIPAALIREDTVVNFKILRVAPAANSYTGNIGLIATYWELISV